MTRVLHAEAVVVGDGTSIRDGAVVVDDGGVVLDVGPAMAVRARATGAAVERLSGVLLPGLINAHTHLELSGLRGKTAIGAGFVPWLTSLQRARAEEDEVERDAAIDRAIAHLVEVGVVAVGEVTNSLVAWRRLSRRLLGTIFHEVFAMDRDAGLRAVSALDEARAEHAPPGDAFLYAVAPHALYSTHPDVVRAIVALARPGAPSTMHLAEHAAERAFLATGKGPWVGFLESRGAGPALAAFPVPGQSPVALAAALGVVRENAALVHLTDANAEELDVVAANVAVAVLCPRSNLSLETRLPPLLAMRSRGVVLALGTDSLASSPSLDPLAEARALSDRTPEVPAASLVAAALSGGARAIGWSRELGSIATGRRPGLLHVAPAEGTSLPADLDPSAWLLRNLSLPRRLLAAAGRAEVTS